MLGRDRVLLNDISPSSRRDSRNIADTTSKKCTFCNQFCIFPQGRACEYRRVSLSAGSESRGHHGARVSLEGKDFLATVDQESTHGH